MFRKKLTAIMTAAIMTMTAVCGGTVSQAAEEETDSTVYITVEPASGMAGSSVPVTVDIQSDYYIWFAGVSLTYDSSLTPVPADPDEPNVPKAEVDLRASTYDEPEENLFALSVKPEKSEVVIGSTEDIFRHGRVTVWFDIPADAAAGTQYPLSLRVNSLWGKRSMYYGMQQQLPSSLKDGSITVTDQPAVTTTAPPVEAKFDITPEHLDLTDKGADSLWGGYTYYQIPYTASENLDYIEWKSENDLIYVDKEGKIHDFSFSPDDDYALGMVTATAYFLDGTVLTDTVTVYVERDIQADIALTPPTKTEYMLGETIDYSGESCTITLLKPISDTQMLRVIKELRSLSDLTAWFGDIQITDMLDEDGNKIEASYQGAFYSETIEIGDDSVVAKIGPYMSTPTKPGTYTVKVVVKTKDEKHVFAEKSFDISVKDPAAATTTTTSITAKPTTTVTTSTTAKPTTTTAKATTTFKVTMTVKATTTTAKAATTTARATTTTAKAATTTARATTTTAKVTTTTAKVTTTTAKVTTTTAKAATTTARATTTTARATTTTAKVATTTAKAATTTAKAATTTAKAATTTARATTTTARATTTTARATTTTAKVTTTTAKVATTTAKAATTTAAAMTTVPVQTTTAAPPEPEILKGDVNDDGEVGVEDAQMTLKAYTKRIAGLDMELTERQIKAANVNDDGELSVDDAQFILRYYTLKQVAGMDVTWEELFSKQKKPFRKLGRSA